MLKSKSERALLIVDMINDYAHESGGQYMAKTKDLIPYILGELRYFRERMRPVFFCNDIVVPPHGVHPDEALFRAEVVQELSPRTGEGCLHKTRPNAFFKTDLAVSLSKLNVEQLTIVGVSFADSVLLTAASALDNGIKVVVPETCVASDNERDHQAAMRLLQLWQKR